MPVGRNHQDRQPLSCPAFSRGDVAASLAEYYRIPMPGMDSFITRCTMRSVWYPGL